MTEALPLFARDRILVSRGGLGTEVVRPRAARRDGSGDLLVDRLELVILRDDGTRA